MQPRLALATLFAVVAIATPAPPVSAHGDHDARPLARALPAGPYLVSLWQVYADAGDDLTPHLIVMVEDSPAADTAGAAARVDLRVAVNARPIEIRPSATTAMAWEGGEGLDVGDAVSVTIVGGAETWDVGTVVVPPAPSSLLPMRELIYLSIALTAGAAIWAARRTARAWRRPAVQAP